MAQAATDVLAPSTGKSNLSVDPNFAKSLGDITQEYKQLETERSELKPPPPMEPIPPFQAKQTGPDQMWGSAAMMLAAIGSLFTRRPLVTALNAASSVLKAFHQGDMEAAKEGFEAWKISSENYLKLKNYELETYKAISTKYAADSQAFWAHVRATAAEFNDPFMQEVALTKSQQKYDSLMMEHERLMLSFEKGQEGLAEKGVIIDNYKAILEARKEMQDAQKTGNQQKITEAHTKLNEAIQTASDWSLANGKGQGRFYSMPTLIANRYLQEHPDATTEDMENFAAGYWEKMSASRNLGTRMAGISFARAELERLLPQALSASKDLDRTQYPTANAVLLAYQRGIGDPKVKRLAVALQGVKAAFAQVLTRGGQSTDAARAAADDLFNSNDPHSVIKAAFDQIEFETGAVTQVPPDVERDIRNIGSGGGRATAPFAPDASWPSAKGVKNGKVLMDDSGNVIAKARNGQWVAP